MVTDIVLATLGGGLIGLAASIMLLGTGRIAGISGSLEGLLALGSDGWSGRASFVSGLLLAGAVGVLAMPEATAYTLPRSTGALVLAGLAVGFGTRLGGGCTSGHGVCGNARLSRRSMAATVIFIAVGMGTASVITHGFGGAL